MSASWPKVPLKYLVSKIGSGKTPKGGAEVYTASGVMLLRSQNVHFEGLRLDDVVHIDETMDEDMASTRVRPNDVLLNITGASIGRCTVVPSVFEAANVNQHVCIIRPKARRLLPAFLNLVLQSPKIQSEIRFGENGSSREGLNFEQVGAFEIPLPPMPEQVTCVELAQASVKRVEWLIGAKQDLLTLLAEKRRALIANAVIRGLNPIVPMRDSGIEWLCKVPAHWQTECTRWLLKEIDDRSEDGSEELLTVSHLTGVTTRAEKDVNMFLAESNEGYKRCRAGDLVINTLWAWMGAMGVARQDGIVSPAYNVYRPIQAFDPDYLDHLVRTPMFVTEITRYSKGVWSSRMRLYPEGLYEASMPVPPLHEQVEIVKIIADEVQRMDALSDATKATITLLEERRTALIAQAVAGQD
jgi:type I restriction enzyme S subunit